MAVPVVVAKAAAVILSNEKGRKAIGWLLVAVLSPVILMLVLLFAFLQGGTKHNADMVYLCFYGGDIPTYTPAEFNDYIGDMRYSFQLLDGQIATVNAKAGDAKLDPVRIKSVFFSLYFGLDSPSRRDHRLFVECFYEMEEREREVEAPNPDYDPDDEDSTEPETITVTETYEVPVPIQSLDTVYANIASKLGITATPEQRQNAAAIYRMIAGYDDGVGSGFNPELPFVGIDGFTAPIGGDWRSHTSSEFGWRSDPFTGERDFHRGLDLWGPIGEPIYAALGGVVIGVGTDPNSSYGYHVQIDHGGGFVTLYAHNSSVMVSPGQQVTAGQQIARMGETGRAKGVHCHFEVSINGELHNPREFLP